MRPPPVRLRRRCAQHRTPAAPRPHTPYHATPRHVHRPSAAVHTDATDPNHWFGFDILFGFIHSFRMPVFFVMAGFFAALLVDKRGLRGTLRNRAATLWPYQGGQVHEGFIYFKPHLPSLLYYGWSWPQSRSGCGLQPVRPQSASDKTHAAALAKALIHWASIARRHQ